MYDIPSREPHPIEVPVEGTLTGFLLLPQGSVGLVTKRQRAHTRRW